MLSLKIMIRKETLLAINQNINFYQKKAAK